MPERNRAIDELSLRRVVGFACNQAFLFYLFYMGANHSIGLGAAAFERADLVALLAFMVTGFAMLARLPEVRRNQLLSRPWLIAYGVFMATASLYVLVPGRSPALVACASALLGVTAAYLLTAWGRSFVAVPSKVAIPEVFLGSLVAALACLLFSLASVPETLLLIRVFPVASAAWIDSFQVGGKRAAGSVPEGDRAFMLSWKILCGTLCFGAAAGCMETYGTQPGGPANPTCQIGMLLFGAFLLGALSLLLAKGSGKVDALNMSYRLAVFVMVLGAMVIPSGISAVLPGEAMVLAGYLGLEVVLISLFLVMANISETDGVAAFTRGFMALFTGEVVGVAASNGATIMAGDVQTPYAVVVAAGCLALLSYVFLFTERDFDDLSNIVTDTDTFDVLCEAIATEYGLSRREAEILPFALRGRTASRIAEELSISKSTVDTHLRRINGKTGVHGRQELLDLGDRMREKL